MLCYASKPTDILQSEGQLNCVALLQYNVNKFMLQFFDVLVTKTLFYSIRGLSYFNSNRLELDLKLLTKLFFIWVIHQSK